VTGVDGQAREWRSHPRVLREDVGDAQRDRQPVAEGVLEVEEPTRRDAVSVRRVGPVGEPMAEVVDVLPGQRDGTDALGLGEGLGGGRPLDRGHGGDERARRADAGADAMLH